VASRGRRMNEVNARRARLVLGWVTVFGPQYTTLFKYQRQRARAKDEERASCEVGEL